MARLDRTRRWSMDPTRNITPSYYGGQELRRKRLPPLSEIGPAPTKPAKPLYLKLFLKKFQGMVFLSGNDYSIPTTVCGPNIYVNTTLKGNPAVILHCTFIMKGMKVFRLSFKIWKI